MSVVLLTAAGGTRAWRRRAAAVLFRDRYVCKMMRDGAPCGAPATTVNHIVPRVLGGSDEMFNLEAACVPCNMGAGGKLRGRAGAITVENHAAVTSLVRLLDQHGVATTCTRATALVTIRQYASHPYWGAQIDAAIHHRRARGPLVRV